MERTGHTATAKGADNPVTNVAGKKIGRRDGVFILNMTLYRPMDGHKQESELTLAWIPETIADLQDQIQEQFNIPVFDQKLTFGPTVLSGKESLQSYSLRNGDHLTLEYSSEADVKAILDIISYVQKTHTFLQSIAPQLELSDPISDTLGARLHAEINMSKFDSFSNIYLASSPQRRVANCLLFVQKDGLARLQQLHSLLLKQPWKKTMLVTQVLEVGLNRMLWTLTSNSESEAAGVSKDIDLYNIVRSFLRVAIIPTAVITPPLNRNMERYGQYQVQILSELILNALGTLTCVLEYDLRPEQLSMVTTSQFFEQIIGILLSTAFPFIAAQMAMTVLVLLSYHSAAHQHMCKPQFVSGLIRSWGKAESTQNITDDERAHFKYQTSVVIAQLCATRKQLHSLPQSLQLTDLLSDFLSHADYSKMRTWEDESGYTWRKFVPYMRVAFFPYLAKGSMSADSHCKNLQILCTEISLFSLQLILCREKERVMFASQGLLEYVVCLPSVLPAKSRAQQRAKDLVAMLGKEMHLQPPSLNTMTRARLAVTHFGLEKVLKTPVQELLLEVYPTL